MFTDLTAPAIPAVSVEEAATRPQDTALLDVRSAAEWAAGHAPGAIHVPLGELSPHALPDAPTLHVICRSGNRSGMAVRALRRAGYDAHNVVGGMGAWVDTGLDVVRDGGGPGTVI